MDSNIIHINFNLPEYDHLLEYRSLYDYVNSRYVKDKENFVCIDEVQMCAGFEKAINGLHAADGVLKSIYVNYLQERNYSEPPLFKDEIRMT